MKKIITLLILLVFAFNHVICQSNTQFEMKVIDDFVLDSHDNLSFQNGMNMFIDKPKNDIDALEKGFKLTQFDAEQNGRWKILAAKNVKIEKQKYRAVLYDHKDKKYIALYKKEKSGEYYFRIFHATYHHSKTKQ